MDVVPDPIHTGARVRARAQHRHRPEEHCPGGGWGLLVRSIHSRFARSCFRRASVSAADGAVGADGAADDRPGREALGGSGEGEVWVPLGAAGSDGKQLMALKGGSYGPPSWGDSVKKKIAMRAKREIQRIFDTGTFLAAKCVKCAKCAVWSGVIKHTRPEHKNSLPWCSHGNYFRYYPFMWPVLLWHI